MQYTLAMKLLHFFRQKGRVFLFSLYVVTVLAGLEAQASDASVQLFRSASGPYLLTERSNWSRYDNGTYTGHVYRETRASLQPVHSVGAAVASYSGHYIVLEETLRDLSRSARSLDALIPVQFSVLESGEFLIHDDKGYPQLRGFPRFPREAVQAGDSWTAPGSRVVDPRNEGNPVIMPILVQYEYRGQELYKDIPVHRIFAKYATRYRSEGMASSFTSAQGTHNVDILIRITDGLPLMMRDQMDETFRWADGSTLRYRGFVLCFTEGQLPMNRAITTNIIRGILSDKPGSEAQSPRPSSAAPGEDPALPTSTARPDLISTGADVLEQPDDSFEMAVFEGEIEQSGVDIASVPEGLKLTVKDIRFAPDSDRILPEEQGRLDILARAVAAVPHKNILVEGHTAAVGKPEGEQELSVLRAKRIVEELISRGIEAQRLLYKGWGGTKPIASNANEEGRSRNRRVEITILD